MNELSALALADGNELSCFFWPQPLFRKKVAYQLSSLFLLCHQTKKVQRGQCSLPQMNQTKIDTSKQNLPRRSSSGHDLVNVSLQQVVLDVEEHPDPEQELGAVPVQVLAVALVQEDLHVVLLVRDPRDGLAEGGRGGRGVLLLALLALAAAGDGARKAGMVLGDLEKTRTVRKT